MPDLSGIRWLLNKIFYSNELILFLATKDCLLPWVVAAAAHPLGGVRFLKIKYKIGFRVVLNSLKSNGSLLYKKKILFMVKTV